MADPHLAEPLLTEAEGFATAEFPMLDEELLDQLRSLGAAEAGTAGADDQPVQDEDVYKMRELIREKPKDVIQYLEEEGVAKLGQFEIQDAIAFKAFGKESIMTTGADHYEVDWESMWKEQLAEYSRNAVGIGWTTKITMAAHVVNLRDAAAEGSKGLLHPLLKRYNARGCSAAVFALPAVQAVIHFKWTTWARQFLLYELGCYLAWLAGYTIFTLLFQQEDWTMTFWETMQDSTAALLAACLKLASCEPTCACVLVKYTCKNGFMATVFSLITLVPMAPFLYMELCTIAAYGVGWVGAWNVMDMISYVLQVVICVLHLQRDFMDEGWFSVMVATQHVLMWTKLHYFAKGFNPTKTTLVDTVSRIVEDMKWFLVFLGLTMVGFALAFYSLYRQDRDKFPDFTNIWHSFASMYSYMLAMFDYNVFYSSTNPTAAMLLFVVFEFMMNVLLLNVLIASMTNSFSKISQDEGLRFLTSKAEIFDELESTLPKWVRSKGWYPTFVHILKFHPDSTYEVNLNSVWSGMGLMENNLLGAQQETRLRVEELEERVAKLHKKLDVLIKLFISSMSPSHSIGMSRQPTAQGVATPAGFGGASAAATAGFAPVYSGSAAPYPHHALSMSAAEGIRAGGGQLGSSFGSPAGFGSNAHVSGAQTQGASTPRAIRHALSSLPEALAAVSGPLAPALVGHGLGNHSMGLSAYPYGHHALAPGHPFGHPAYGYAPVAGLGVAPAVGQWPFSVAGLALGKRSNNQQRGGSPVSTRRNSASGLQRTSGSPEAGAAAGGDATAPDASPFSRVVYGGHSIKRSSGRPRRASGSGEDDSSSSQPPQHQQLLHSTATAGDVYPAYGVHGQPGAHGRVVPTASAVQQQYLPVSWRAVPGPVPALLHGRGLSYPPAQRMGGTVGADQEGRQFIRQFMLARSHSL